MRIGTWNLAGRWTAAHEGRLLEQDCDIWLLTEVSERLAVPGYQQHATRATMGPKRRWSAVLSRQAFIGLPDPHPASAAIVIDRTTYCSSILPWRSCGNNPPWIGARHVDKTMAAVTDLDAALPSGRLVWGGDWNHALSGTEYGGSIGGRTAVQAMLDRRGLHVPTAPLPHRIEGLLSIDHIAVGRDVEVRAADRFSAVGLSDHDGYTIRV